MKRLMLLLFALTLLFVALAKVKVPNRSFQASSEAVFTEIELTTFLYIS